MGELYLYAIMKAENPNAIRFGWVSPITGITYCGICLGAAVTPQVGAQCGVCGAHVAQLLDIRIKGDDWRRTWKDAFTADELASCG
ncbi:hypothetical protein DYQ86_24885 [Acidobacteria bacterium AB60]|nr:hypothetical protein DYQ86_24885 [Acidobacteria bacterium AB60]